MPCQLQNGFESRPVRHISCSIRLSALFFSIHTQIHAHKLWLALAIKVLFAVQLYMGLLCRTGLSLKQN